MSLAASIPNVVPGPSESAHPALTPDVAARKTIRVVVYLVERFIVVVVLSFDKYNIVDVDIDIDM
jgi:hypothetical protein